MKKSQNSSAVSFGDSSREANFLFSGAMLPLALIYFEVILHTALKIEWSTSSWMYVLFSSLILGAILFSIATFLPYKVNRIILLVMTFAIGFTYAIYEVYYSFFQAYIDFGALGEAGNMFRDFFGNIVSTTFKNLIWIALFLLPFVLYLFLTKRMVRVERTPLALKGVLCALALVLCLMRGALVSLNNGEYGDRFYYNEGFNSTISANRFGLLTSIRLNAKYTLFGLPDGDIPDVPGTESIDWGQLFGTKKPSDDITISPDSGSENETTPPPTPFDPVDRLTVDFDALISSESKKAIKDLHEYFGSVAPTKTNVYTGMFEGKNLIYITAEGFSSVIIDPVLTPTLYKLSTEGFVFKNCYNSLWGGSTATGEYLSMTGLFFNTAQCMRLAGGVNDGKVRNMYYAIGNTFKRENYSIVGFHNNGYTYYNRHKSYPAMGIDKFIAANKEGYTDGITYSAGWPSSDLEMAQLSTPYYIDSESPFLAYYMTVSGHANYSWSGNTMSKKHRDDVAHLNYSEEVKAYIACNLELELMVKNLIEQLEAKGKLDDTVFVIGADHYPYALSDDAVAELYGLPVEGIRENFDTYRNSFMIWSSSMKEPVIVEKYCSSMDIIPTVYNLFGIEYDSRLLMGIDLMSDSPGLVILNAAKSSWNWITDFGAYSTSNGKFTPHPDVTIGDSAQLNAYIKNINSVVSGKRTASLAILNQDYYSYVFK